MGCCNGSMLVLIICTIQLVSILERLVLDFMGYLYLSIIPGFVQIIVVIIAIFGLCLYKHKLLIVYLVWNVIYIAWNIFVICLYLGVGSLTESSPTVLAFGASKSWWLSSTEECSKTNSCAIHGTVVEAIHAGLQILLSVVGCVSSAFVIYLLREKDDTNPVFQVYKAPSSRRSSISLRMDRETTLTRPEPWELSGQGRDSLRSNRSTRSTRATNGSQSGTRQSKRSNKGSTRSKKSSSGRAGGTQNGSAKGNRPNLPWAPTIAPSSGLDSDAPQSPQTPPGRRHRRDRGHENESYGYGSSSENPYTDKFQRSHNFTSPGPPPGPAPHANKRLKPTNLGPTFNTAADLPPPLDEGPEAYSRDSVAFPAPPPPLSDGPEPYRSTRHQGRGSSRSMHSRPTQLEITPTPTKQALSSSPSSPGSSSVSTEKSMTAFSSNRTLENNLDRPSYSNKNYHMPPFPVMDSQPSGRPAAPNKHPANRYAHSPDPPSLDHVDRSTENSSRHSEALSNPIYNNHQLPDARTTDSAGHTPNADVHKLGKHAHRPGIDPYRPSIDPHRPAADPHRPDMDPHRPGVNPQKPDVNPHRPGVVDPHRPGVNPHRPDVDPHRPGVVDSHRPGVNKHKPSVDPHRASMDPRRPTVDPHRPSMDPHRPAVDARRLDPGVHGPDTEINRSSPDTRPSALVLPSKQPYRDTERNVHGETNGISPDEQTSPSTDLRQIRSRDSQPKDNTFKRMVTGNLSLSTNGPSSIDSRPPPSSNMAMQRMPPSQVHPSNQNQHIHQPHNVQSAANNLHTDIRPPPRTYDRSQDPRNNTSATSSGPSNQVRQQSAQPNRDYTSTSAPPWQRNVPTENAMRNTSNNPRIPAQQPPVNTQSSNSMTGTLKEVTSSYGGLYSSRQSPAPSRRRGNLRHNNDQNYPSTNAEPYQSTNITDDVKTTKGPFISSHPSVI